MKKRITVVAVVALVLRLVVTLALPSRPFSDFRSYFLKAEALADRGSLEGMSAMHPPGYPAVLALVFVATPGADRLLVAKLTNCLLGVAIVLLGAGLARRFWGETAALIAAIALAVSPRQLLMPSLIASENLFTPLAFAFVLLVGNVWRNDKALPRAAATGAVIGLLALTRAVAYFVGIIWLVAAWAGGRRWRGLAKEFALLVLVQHAVMLPQAVNNYVNHGRFTFLTCSGGTGLFIGNNDHATGLWYPEWKSHLEALRPEVVGASNFEVNDAAKTEAVRWILDNPGRALALYVAKLGWIVRQDHLTSTWTTDPASWRTSPASTSEAMLDRAEEYWLVRHRQLVIGVERFGGWSVFIVGILGAVVMVRSRAAFPSPTATVHMVALLGMTAYTPLVSALIAVNGRYRWPVEDLLVLLAALAVTAVLRSRFVEPARRG